MSRPLEGLRVLELATGVAGPYAGRLLATLGATVVKVEPQGGDPARTKPVDTAPTRGPSPLFVHLSASKRSMNRDAVDLDAAVRWADVVIDDAVRSTATVMPHDVPGLLVSVTPWGFDAEAAGRVSDELLVQAACGLMGSSVDDDGRPLRFPGWQSQYLAGGYAAAAALAALGRGDVSHVDVDWAGAMLSGIEGAVTASLYEASARDRGERQTGFQAGAFPSGVFRCADGHVVPGTVRPVDWVLQCQVYGRPDLLDDPRFDWRGRFQNRDALRAELQPWYDRHTKREIFEAALASGWAAAMVMTPTDVLEDPHLQHRRFLSPVSGLDGVMVPGCPWRSSDVPAGEPVTVPALGEADGEPLPQGPRLEARDLRGVKVLELTWAWAGPFVGRFAGAMGADVVHVETGAFPDGWRTRMRWRRTGAAIPPGEDPDAYTWDAAALFNSLNRNKRSVSIDLRVDDGRKVFLDLLEQADALVVNMTATVLRDRGIEDAVLRLVSERGLVVLTMPALGHDGPYRAMPGYGMLMEGMGGFGALYGQPDEGARVSSTYYPDAVAGLHGTVALFAALAAGRGAFLDLSQQETMWMQLGEGIALRTGEGRERRRDGEAEPGCAVSGLFPAKDGEWVAVVAADDQEADAVARVAGELGPWVRERAGDDAVRALATAGVPAALVAGHRSLPLAVATEEVAHEAAGVRPYLALPVRFDGVQVPTLTPAPRFGAHTDDVLREWLGLEQQEVDRLRGCAAIGTVPAQPRRRDST